MQKNLDKFSDAELEAELARRAEENKQSAIPQPNSNINWTPLLDYIKQGVQEVADGKGEPKDFEHWIFETAMDVIYGGPNGSAPEFWKWWNKNL